MSYSKAVKPPASPPPVDVKPAWACFAHGCPAVGSIGAPGQRYCLFHDNMPAATWQAITDHLRRREWLVRMAYAMRSRETVESMPDWAGAARRRCIEHNRLDLAPAGKELTSAWLYSARLFSALRKECSVERPTEEKDRTPSASEWRSLASAVGSLAAPTTEEGNP